MYDWSWYRIAFGINVNIIGMDARNSGRSGLCGHMAVYV
jgi:hypothetical protein